jgi:large repetitive protein
VVADHGSGPVTCRLFFNGAERWAGGCAGTADIPVAGLAYSTTYDVYAVGANSFGTGPAGAHASARTNDPPPQPPTIVVSKGGATVKPGCAAPCNFVSITLQNFAPNTAYSISCDSDYPPPSGPFYTFSARTDGAGNYSTGGMCWFGYPGRHVWVTAGGVTSNTVTW